MFVFIAHAEADQAAADDLKAFLKTRGLTAETETGARSFRHLGASDVAIVLWSQKSAFATHRMQVERRMLDAWADQQLVLVKLDHGFLPVGVRDLPAIDASFEQSRQLAAWPQVEQAARDAIKRLQADRAGVEGVGSAWHEDSGPRERMRDLEARDKSASVEFGASAPGAAGSTPESQSGNKFVARSRSPRVHLEYDITQPAKASMFSVDEESPREPRQSRRIPWLTIAIGIAIIAGITLFGVFVLQLVGKEPLPFKEYAVSRPVALGGGAVAVFLLLIVAIRSSRSRRKSSAKKTPAATPARVSNGRASEAATVPVAQAAAPPQPAPALLFVSYAHADDAAVSPIVLMVESAGRHVWIDKTGIQTGDGWAGEIVRAIKAAKGVIVMCSKHAFESDHIKREVYLADRYKKPMVPLFIEEAAPPEDFEYFFASVQWLELFKLPEADRAAAVGQALKAV